MNNRILVAGLFLLAVLSILLRGFLREVVVAPLLYAGWLAYVLIDSTSRLLLWGVFVLLAAVVAAKSVARRPIRLRSSTGQTPQRERITDLARLIDDAHDDPLSRWQIAQRLRQVTLQMIADREQIPLQEARKQLNQGGQAAPREIRAYLQARLPAGRSRRRDGSANAALDLDPELVVGYLEEQLRLPQGGPG